MLKSLKLKNFRKHEDREFLFTPGFNILRGENEIGKSTIYEAIGYALFGSMALRESLDEVVTYDKPVASLKVELVIEIDSVEYKIVRGKSGAEVNYADQRVSGQTETKRFFERLLVTTAETFSVLAISGQGEVRGVLSKGATATNGLVESLAKLSVVEEIIDKIQNQLPSGNTNALSQQIAAVEIKDEPAKPVLEDTSTIQSRLQEIAQKLGSANSRLPDANNLAIAEVAVKKAGDAARDYQKQQERNKRLSEGHGLPVPPKITEEDVAAAREAVANESFLAYKRKAYAVKFTVPEQVWEGSLESFNEHLATAKTKMRKLSEDAAEAGGQLSALAKTKIQGTSCPTCKRELPDAESIAQHNAEHDKRTQELTALKTKLTAEAAEATKEVRALEAILAVNGHNYTLCGDCWTFDTSKQVPGTPVWIGEPPKPAGPLPDVAAMDKELNDFKRKLIAYEAVQAQLDEPMPVVPNVDTEIALIAENESVRREIAGLEQDQRGVEKELQAAESANALKQLAYERDVQEREKAIEHKQGLQNTLAEMAKHNELIKKLRGARPTIATKLWGTVLGAVSHYTSSIRGEVSMITKDEEGFKINGRKVTGLSGSGQDALGLAIRIALSKVFLPGLPFLMLDEAFAACSDTRETNGLGTLAAAGFTQTILVTHSDLGDSFADNLIQL